jgi:hypothetical protein
MGDDWSEPQSPRRRTGALRFWVEAIDQIIMAIYSWAAIGLRPCSILLFLLNSGSCVIERSSTPGCQTLIRRPGESGTTRWFYASLSRHFNGQQLSWRLIHSQSSTPELVDLSSSMEDTFQGIA